MVEFSSIEPSAIQETISSHFKGDKIMMSNYYGLDKGDECGITFSDQTIIIRKKEQSFFRAYIVTSNLSVAVQMLKELKDNQYVFNIPSKRPIDEWKDLFELAGYKNIGHYSRFYNKKIKNRKSALGEFANLDDFKMVKALLDNNFSIYTDYLPTLQELHDMIINNRVIVNRSESGEVKGVLIYTIEGKKCYLNVWIDKSGNGLFLLYKAYNIVYEHGISYVYFWVNNENTEVIKLHQLMGAMPDGLNDYTFINK